PHIPLMPSSDTALVTPDERFSAEELVDIELQRLGSSDVVGVEPNVVSEVVQARNQRLFCIGQALGREVADQVIVPQRVGILSVSADVVLGSVAALGRGLDARPARPGNVVAARGAGTANCVRDRQQAIAGPATLGMQVVE